MNNSVITQEEIDLIRDLFKDNSKQKNINENTEEVLLKIGEILPVSNRGGKGKNIIKMIKDLR